jgi:probable HAF family extracellular repeat protein
MNVRYRLATMLVAAVLATAPSSIFAQTPRAYRVDDLGSFGGPDLVGLAINNNGEIAGYGYLPNGTIHAFRWTESGGLEDLGANGGWISQAIGINDNGEAVGVYLDASNQPHGFVAPRGGVMRDLRTPDRQIVRVNSMTNDGRMTGMLYSFTPSFQVHAFRTLSDDTLEDLGSTVYASVGWHINDAGEVSGYEARNAIGTEQSAFRLSDALGKVDLGTLGGARSSGMSINNSGVVVGWSEGAAGSWARAFRARPGFPIEDLGTLGGFYAGAEAINDAGAVVGWSTGHYFMTAFVHTDADGMIDLNTRVPPAEGGRVMYDALGINNAGQIVVLYYTDAGTGTRRLTPIVDHEPPVITSATASPDVLTPPDGWMSPVTVAVSAADNLDPAPTCTIASVTNSEAPPSGVDPDVEITAALTLSLRASRLGTGLGRTYTITVRCTDYSGNAATAELFVRVPHDSR